MCCIPFTKGSLLTVNLCSLLYNNTKGITLGIRIYMRNLGDTSLLSSLVNSIGVAIETKKTTDDVALCLTALSTHGVACGSYGRRDRIQLLNDAHATNVANTFITDFIRIKNYVKHKIYKHCL